MIGEWLYNIPYNQEFRRNVFGIYHAVNIPYLNSIEIIGLHSPSLLTLSNLVKNEIWGFRVILKVQCEKLLFSEQSKMTIHNSTRPLSWLFHHSSFTWHCISWHPFFERQTSTGYTFVLPVFAVLLRRGNGVITSRPSITGRWSVPVTCVRRWQRTALEFNKARH